MMNLKNRFFAAGVHLSISLVTAALAWALVSKVWYPYPFIEISGGGHLFLLLVAVDIVLGSVLTFAVFSSGKLRRVLMRDLMVIGLLQLTALTYGLRTVYIARPIYIVYEVDRFKVVTAADVDVGDLRNTLPQFQHTPIRGVQTIGIRQARDHDDKLRSLELELAGKDLSLQTEWWQPISEQNRISMRQHGMPIHLLRKKAKNDGTEIDKILLAAGLLEKDAIALPLLTRLASWSVILDRHDLKIVGYLPVDLF
jgi:hypothetical protein